MVVEMYRAEVSAHGQGMSFPRGSKGSTFAVGRKGIATLGGFVGAAFVAAVDAGLKLLGASGQIHINRQKWRRRTFLVRRGVKLRPV